MTLFNIKTLNYNENEFKVTPRKLPFSYGCLSIIARYAVHRHWQTTRRQPELQAQPNHLRLKKFSVGIADGFTLGAFEIIL